MVMAMESGAVRAAMTSNFMQGLMSWEKVVGHLINGTISTPSS
jgi:hypothetical protein